jgi:hypothetical protein
MIIVYVIIALALVGLTGIAMSARVIKRYERVVLFELGNVKGEARGPRVIFIFPFVDRVHRVVVADHAAATVHVACGRELPTATSSADLPKGRTRFLIDVAPGAAEDFSLEGLEGVHFISRSPSSARRLVMGPHGLVPNHPACRSVDGAVPHPSRLRSPVFSTEAGRGRIWCCRNRLLGQSRRL